jgi:hypothetical protein
MGVHPTSGADIPILARAQTRGDIIDIPVGANEYLVVRVPVVRRIIEFQLIITDKTELVEHLLFVAVGTALIVPHATAKPLVG